MVVAAVVATTVVSSAGHGMIAVITVTIVAAVITVTIVLAMDFLTFHCKLGLCNVNDSHRVLWAFHAGNFGLNGICERLICPIVVDGILEAFCLLQLHIAGFAFVAHEVLYLY